MSPSARVSPYSRARSSAFGLDVAAGSSTSTSAQAQFISIESGSAGVIGDTISRKGSGDDRRRIALVAPIRPCSNRRPAAPAQAERNRDVSLLA
jgi:hypothetical protein